MNNGHLLVAYHGCDAVTRDDLVSARLASLDRSNNHYDWLGPGVYFFENDPARALIFATEACTNPDKQYTQRPVVTPAVVGVMLCVQRCLDMTTQAGIDEFSSALEETTEAFGVEQKQLPRNQAASDDDTTILLRELDSLVFRVLHSTRSEAGLAPYQLVRGAFSQGAPIVANSGFSQRSHIQLAVLDPSCFLGWFLPPGAALMNDQQYAEARKRRDAARSDRLELKRAKGRAQRSIK